MVLYAKFRIPADGFRIGRAFGQLPDVRVELDRIVPTTSSVIPFVWVQGADRSDVVRATRRDGAVEHIESINSEEGGWVLYRVVWNRSFRDTVVAIAESDVTLLSGEGTADDWWFEFRAANREPLSELHDYLRANGVEPTVVRVTEVDVDRKGNWDHLTESQVEALRLAHERGYFHEPRDVDLEALATEVGISRQAFSGRLRRGISSLVSETLVESTN
ncbi:helix-turn-helix domain-containing protein [Halomarina salina]|uniref:Helix-turn-helix domain-containing protein n=1 Tax=Halomarina salina TaxID=1872699 RepID=A0ABD5RPT1_9EURY|nr:helix-turn-helix domain-containing protein [Halomarina salina]